jgi:hypothetical protein
MRLADDPELERILNNPQITQIHADSAARTDRVKSANLRTLWMG